MGFTPNPNPNPYLELVVDRLAAEHVLGRVELAVVEEVADLGHHVLGGGQRLGSVSVRVRVRVRVRVTVTVTVAVPVTVGFRVGVGVGVGARFLEAAGAFSARLFERFLAAWSG